MKSCYIHIPFCSSICSYCDFCKMFYQEEQVDKYLIALEKEMNSLYQNEELETIYIGGGTPSCLSLNQLKHLFQILKKLKRTKNCEFTIEGNFNSTTKDKLELYQEVGINRLSFGLESIHSKNLEFLKRKEEKEQVELVLKNARDLGFHNINIDLIYALPTEDLKELKEDLDYLFSLQVEHISTYSLIIEDHTLLKIQNTKNIKEELDEEMYQMICKEMKKEGYNHYEISNFSKPNFESKHNLTYWNNEEYYGFGLGSSSYYSNKRITNTRSLTDYLKGNRVKEVENLSLEDKIEYEILLNLRKKEGISLSSFQEKYHKELKEYYDYSYLLENNFLKEEENHLRIPEEKWYVSNEIIVEILERKKYE